MVSLYQEKPKPLIQFKDKHFLSYLVNHYSKYPFEKIFILAGYKGIQIFNKFNKKISNGIEIECLIEKQTLGTGGALAQLRLKLSNDLIVMNADSFIDCNLERFFFQQQCRFSSRERTTCLLVLLLFFSAAFQSAWLLLLLLVLLLFKMEPVREPGRSPSQAPSCCCCSFCCCF